MLGMKYIFFYKMTNIRSTRKASTVGLLANQPAYIVVDEMITHVWVTETNTTNELTIGGVRRAHLDDHFDGEE